MGTEDIDQISGRYNFIGYVVVRLLHTIKLHLLYDFTFIDSPGTSPFIVNP